MKCKATRHVIRVLDDPDYHSGPYTHVSELVRRLAVNLRVLEPDEDEESCQSMIAAGMAWELWWAGWMDGQADGFVHQPGEFVRDGVIGRPDGLSVDDVGMVVEECKFTRKSAKGHNPIESPKWMMWRRQVMAYCSLTETTKARLWALHVNGEYEKHRFGEPLMLDYRFEFTQAELDQNWKLLLGQKRQGE